MIPRRNDAPNYSDVFIRAAFAQLSLYPERDSNPHGPSEPGDFESRSHDPRESAEVGNSSDGRASGSADSRDDGAGAAAGIAPGMTLVGGAWCEVLG